MNAESAWLPGCPDVIGSYLNYRRNQSLGALVHYLWLAPQSYGPWCLVSAQVAPGIAALQQYQKQVVLGMVGRDKCSALGAILFFWLPRPQLPNAEYAGQMGPKINVTNLAI